jgi:hypothetical protein
MQDDRKRNKKAKKKIRKPVDTDKKIYDEYGEKKIDNFDYEKDRPPHY